MVLLVLEVWQAGRFLPCPQCPWHRKPLQGFFSPRHTSRAALLFPSSLLSQLNPFSALLGSLPAPTFGALPGPISSRASVKCCRKFMSRSQNDNNCRLEKAPSLEADGWWVGPGGILVAEKQLLSDKWPRPCLPTSLRNTWQASITHSELGQEATELPTPLEPEQAACGWEDGAGAGGCWGSLSGTTDLPHWS